MDERNYMFKLEAVVPSTIRDNVLAKKGNSVVWDALEGQSIASVQIPVGTWRAPHLHTNTSELAVIVSGSARAGIQLPAGQSRDGILEYELSEGDCIFFPKAWTHWLRNTGDKPVIAYFNYAHEKPETIEVSQLRKVLAEASHSHFVDSE